MRGEWPIYFYLFHVARTPVARKWPFLIGNGSEKNPAVHRGLSSW